MAKKLKIRTTTWKAPPASSPYGIIRTLQETIRELRDEISRMGVEMGCMQKTILQKDQSNIALHNINKNLVQQIEELKLRIILLEGNLLQLDPQKKNPKVKNTKLLL